MNLRYIVGRASKRILHVNDDMYNAVRTFTMDNKMTLVFATFTLLKFALTNYYKKTIYPDS